MPSTSLLLTFAFLLLLGLLLPRVKPGAIGPSAWLQGSAAPIFAAALTMGLTCWLWGGLDAAPVLHDEVAYVLQAELLATGHLFGPPAPVAEAFTQAAVLVTPVLAPKMLPGHAAVLVPGIWAGLPGLMPVMLAGLTAALIVLLVRRVACAATAVIAVALWTSQAGQQRWRASYLSESTTAVCWLIGWWCLLKWLERGERRWLLAVAAVTGLAAVTRPMAALAFAIPVGVVVVHRCWSRGTWSQLVGAFALGTAILCTIPLQNAIVLGDWRASPLALYTRQYMPFDQLGFGLETTLPERALPPHLDAAMTSLRARHAEHTPAALPRVLGERLRVLTRSVLGGWRIVFLPAVLAGVVVLPAAGWMAIASAAALLMLYLPYAHEPHWSVYYVEAMPIPAMVMAAGIVAILRRLGHDGARVSWGALGLAVISLGMAAPEMAWSATFKRAAQRPIRDFASRIAGLPHGRAIVFVRHAEDFDGHQVLVRNVPNPSLAEVITAHDLGSQINAKVHAAYPDRTAYLFDSRTGVVAPLGGTQ
jgi:hypothetical protein